MPTTIPELKTHLLEMTPEDLKRIYKVGYDGKCPCDRDRIKCILYFLARIYSSGSDKERIEELENAIEFA